MNDMPNPLLSAIGFAIVFAVVMVIAMPDKFVQIVNALRGCVG